jgi:hypothetical protein
LTASLDRAPRSRRRTDANVPGPMLVANPAVVPKPAAVALLAEILARLKGLDLPVVQFIAACPHSEAGHIAHDLAVASVSRFGRTLLLSSIARGDQEGVVRHLAAVRPSPPSVRAVVPDACVPGLYHRRIEEEGFDAAQFAAPAARSGSQAFRMMVLASPTPSLSPTTLMQAAHAHGTIIAVAAGTTPLKLLQATARQVRHAGGTLLGTVLFGAPGREPHP